jgi:hypothetical protein
MLLTNDNDQRTESALRHPARQQVQSHSSLKLLQGVAAVLAAALPSLQPHCMLLRVLLCMYLCY